MPMTPLIAIHLAAALAAVVTGPVALWARRGRAQHPKLHRAFGYAWVAMMLVAATSAIFIHDPRFPTFLGFGPVHLLVPLTYAGLFGAFRSLARGDVAGHRKAMQNLYIGACLVAGAFSLLPQRTLGKLVFSQWLGIA